MKNTYILKHIERYGNCYIPNYMYEKIGEKRIIEYLRKNGYECTIVKHTNPLTDFDKNFIANEVDIVIERID